MSHRLNSLKIKAKLLQKSKKKAGKPIQLKEAYEILAKTAGYESWRHYKAAIENTSDFAGGVSGSSLNVWTKVHQEALQHALETNGYVIPHENYFFVGDRDYLKSIGIDPNDRDLQRVRPV